MMSLCMREAHAAARRPGSAPRPAPRCSGSRATPPPPYSSGTMKPSRPSRPAACQSSRATMPAASHSRVVRRDLLGAERAHRLAGTPRARRSKIVRSMPVLSLPSCTAPLGEQPVDVGDAPSVQGVPGVLARSGRRRRQRGRRAREARRRRRLHDTRRARRTCRGRRGAGGAAPPSSDSTGADAGVGALEHLHPLARVRDANTLGEHGAAAAASARGRRGRGRSGSSARPSRSQQLGVELRLQRADREVPAVGGLVDVVERRAAVEQVDAAAVLPQTGRRAGRGPSSPGGGAVDDGRVDHLAAAAALAPRSTRGEHADDEVQRAAAEVADQVERHLRRPAGAADRVQRAGERDVVDVVPGGAARAGRPGPSRSSGRRPARVAGQARRPVRRRAARRRRAGRPRAARRPGRPGRAPRPPRAGCLRSTATDGRPRLSRSCAGAAERGAPARAGRPGSRRRRGRRAASRRTAPARDRRARRRAGPANGPGAVAAAPPCVMARV